MVLPEHPSRETNPAPTGCRNPCHPLSQHPATTSSSLREKQGEKTVRLPCFKKRSHGIKSIGTPAWGHFLQQQKRCAIALGQVERRAGRLSSVTLCPSDGGSTDASAAGSRSQWSCEYQAGGCRRDFQLWIRHCKACGCLDRPAVLPKYLEPHFQSLL